MDDITYLRYRNIELETELRLVKEQLAQAQGSTQYLVNCLSRSCHAQYRGPNTVRTQPRHQIGQAECAHLNTHPEVGHGTGRRFTSGLASTRPTHSHETYHVNRSHPEPANFQDVDGDDLLTFDFGDSSPSTVTLTSTTANCSLGGTAKTSLIDSPIYTPFTPLTPSHGGQDVFRSASRRDAFGLGIFDNNANPTRPGSVHRGLDSVDSSDDARADNLLSDNESERESEPAVGEWIACHPPPPADPDFVFECRFAPHEHSRLLGAAVFVEDMTEKEQEEHWEHLAQKTNRHPAKEWRFYYNEVVRPIYLMKLQEKMRDAAVGKDDDEVDQHEDYGRGFEGPMAVRAEQGLGASKWAPKAYRDGAHESAAYPDPAIIASDSDQNDLLQRTSFSSVIEVTSESFDRSETVQGEHEGDKSVGVEQESTHARTSIPVEEDPNLQTPPVENSNAVEESLPRLPLEELCCDPGNQNQINPTSCYDGDDEKPNTRPHSASTIKSLPFPRSPPRLFGRPVDASDILFNYDCKAEHFQHTVLISNIPPNISLHQILSAICGGKIVSATFLETAGMRTKPRMETNAALITFLSSAAAKSYVDTRKQNCLLFSWAKWHLPVKATVTLLPTPTRPLHPKLLADFQNGLTRVLFIIDEKIRWTAAEVVTELVHSGVKRPLHAGRDEDGILFFEFADAREAAGAWQVVDRHYWFFDGAGKGFFPDPCARPVGEMRVGVAVGKAEEGSDVDDESESDSEETVDETPGTSPY